MLVVARKAAVALLDRRPEDVSFVLRARAVPYVPQVNGVSRFWAVRRPLMFFSNPAAVCRPC